MGIATSLILFAIGAILRFAVTVTTTGFNLHAIGVILMIVAAVGFVISLVFWGSWGGFGGSRSQQTVVADPRTGVTVSREQTTEIR